MKAARFPAYKDLSAFDFAASEIHEALVRQLHRCEFLDGAENVVLIGGGAGTGKSHVALGIQANRHGKTLDFILSERRDTAAARRFFKQTIATNGQPGLVNIDKSGSNLAGLQAVNVILKFQGNGQLISIRRKKYLNNILEQDHRFIKRITGHMLGFKAFHSAAATIAGIEAAHKIRKGQFDLNGLSPSQQFSELVA